MKEPEIEVYAKAFILYQENLFLIKLINNTWVPIGGHVVKKNNLGKLIVNKDSEIFIKDKILGSSADTEFNLFNYNGIPIISHPPAYLSKSGNYHFDLIYYGLFNKEPILNHSNIEIFSMLELKAMEKKGLINNNIINFYNKCLDLSRENIKSDIEKNKLILC